MFGRTEGPAELIFGHKMYLCYRFDLGYIKKQQASRGTMNQHHSALSEILEKIFFFDFWKLFALYTKS